VRGSLKLLGMVRQSRKKAQNRKHWQISGIPRVLIAGVLDDSLLEVQAIRCNDRWRLRISVRPVRAMPIRLMINTRKSAVFQSVAALRLWGLGKRPGALSQQDYS